MRRVPLLLTVLIAALAAAWLLWNRRPAHVPPPLSTLGSGSVSESSKRDSDLDATPSGDSRQGAAESTSLAANEPDSIEGKERATLVVQVVDQSSHKSLPGMAVGAFRAKRDSRTTLGTAKCNEYGTAEFSLPAGVNAIVYVYSEDDNMNLLTRPVERLTPGERRQVTLEIPTPPTDLHWFGLVLASEDKSPIAGARITIAGSKTQSESSQSPANSNGSVANSGKDGRVEMWLRSSKDKGLRIEAPGFGRAVVPVSKGHDTPETALVVLLSKSARLRAHLVVEGGRAASANSVRLSTDSDQLNSRDGVYSYLGFSETNRWDAAADDSGVCSLDDLPSGVPLNVEILIDGAVLKTDLPLLSLQPGETREVEWHIGSGCELEGVVFDESESPVRDCEIWLMKTDDARPRFFESYDRERAVGTSRTDASGHFGFHDLHSGRWLLGPAATREQFESPDPRAIAAFAQMISIAEADQTQHLELHVSRGLYICGRVLDPQDKPARLALVSGGGGQTLFPPGAMSDYEGRFCVGPLIPGRYSLIARSSDIGADSESVEASPREQEVVLKLRNGGGMRGSVVDGTTGTPCRAELFVSIHGVAVQDELDFMSIMTNEDGTFEIKKLKPGIYDVFARASDGHVGIARSLNVRPGVVTDGVAISIFPGAVIRIRNPLADQPVGCSISCDDVLIGTAWLEPGAVVRMGVSPEHVVIRWSVTWTVTGHLDQRKELDVQVGEEREVVLGGDH